MEAIKEELQKEKAPEPRVVTITHGVDGKVQVQSNLANQFTLIGLLDFAKSVIIGNVLSPPKEERFTPKQNVENNVEDHQL